tara:strand:- start:6430 stop:8298 length:1869 start_codon:yes stop_codon:yes gene_type:complete
MSALQGFTNVLGRASDMSYRRDQAQIQRDRLGLYEEDLELDKEKRAQENSLREANYTYNLARQNGWVTDDGLSLGENFSKALIAGDKNAAQLAKDTLNGSGLVEGGGKITGLTRDEKRGGFMATVENPDGSPGVITEGDGSNAPDAITMFIPDADLTREANGVWNRVMAEQNVIRLAEVVSAKNVIGTSAEGLMLDRERKVKAARIHNKALAVASIPEGAARRQVMSIVNDPNATDEQQDEVIQQIAKDNGIEKDLLAIPVFGDETRLGDYLEREAKQRERLNKGEINQGEFTKWQIENRGKKTQKDSDEVTEQDKVIKSEAEPVQKEFDVAEAITEGKTVDEIADMAIAGDIVLSPQAKQEVAIKLQEAGVQELSDLALLNRKDQALALAVMAATVSPARANFFMEQVRNVMETGVSSTSAKDQADNEIRRGSLQNAIRNTNLNIQKLRKADVKEAIGIASELIQSVRDTFTGSLDKETADAFMDGGTLNKMWVKRQQFPKGSEPRALIDQAINAAVSQVAASYAAEEKGGVWETLASFTRGDAEDNASATDQFLNRVIISNGKVFYTTEPTVDPATGKIDRALLDQNFDLSDLKNKSPQVYTLLKRAAENNTKQLLAANG